VYIAIKALRYIILFLSFNLIPYFIPFFSLFFSCRLLAMLNIYYFMVQKTPIQNTFLFFFIFQQSQVVEFIPQKKVAHYTIITCAKSMVVKVSLELRVLTVSINDNILDAEI